MRPTFTWNEVKRHSKRDDLHFVMEGKGYNATKFQYEHPRFSVRIDSNATERGGYESLLDQGGTDVTELFHDAGHGDEAKALLKTLQVGVVETRVSSKTVTSTLSPQDLTARGQNDTRPNSWTKPVEIGQSTSGLGCRNWWILVGDMRGFGARALLFLSRPDLGLNQNGSGIL
ncbi:cytochrome b5-like heme/steroid binding domain-containing protein [Thelonectria olida]|uniref:Cytochrome b5-like heme/steroid binding domain-containing protein n=1 Tax=Thelonectria olida TaxID=1576542 RepID=A0A9P9AHB3_9HYPO|nr:cytochrome b5-like heme/steroid binding domain-containing protein [Thelonectria olida]